MLEQLYALINARYEEERSVILTTNIIEQEELGEQIGERTVSRLQEMCEPIPIRGDGSLASRTSRPAASSARASSYTLAIDAGHGHRRRPVGR